VDSDTRIEGDTDANLFVADAGLDAIGMGGAAASGQKLKVTGAVTITGVASFTDTTDSTSGTTGSVKLSGGLGVVKNIVTDASIGVGANPAYAIDAQRAGGANRNLLRFGITAVTNGVTIDYTHTGTIVTATFLDTQVIVGAPTGGGKGKGTINAQAVYDDNVLLTDYVFEPGYEVLTIDETETYYKEHLHLPTIPGRDEWEKNGKFSTGQLANYLWETVEVQALHIAELNKRLKELEGRYVH